MKIITRKEAKEFGLKRYYTGKPCKWGHISERLMMGGCIECRREDKYKDLDRRRRKKTSYVKKAAEYRQKNKEKIKQHQSQKYHNNKEYYQKRAAKYYQKNKEKIKNNSKKYWENNKEYYHRKSILRLVLIKEVTPLWYEKEKINKLYKLRDLMTKTWGVQFHIDHIVPLQHDKVCGLHCLDNLRPMIGTLNIAKSNKFV